MYGMFIRLSNVYSLNLNEQQHNSEKGVKDVSKKHHG
jgi:hypothetical protein